MGTHSEAGYAWAYATTGDATSRAFANVRYVTKVPSGPAGLVTHALQRMSAAALFHTLQENRHIRKAVKAFWQPAYTSPKTMTSAQIGAKQVLKCDRFLRDHCYA